MEFVEIESWDPQLQVKLHGFSGRNLDLDFFSLAKIFLMLSPITLMLLILAVEPRSLSANFCFQTAQMQL